MFTRTNLNLKATALAGLALIAAAPAFAQSGTKNGEWRSYGGDLGSTRYAPLDQINSGNFDKLEVAWRFKTDYLGPRPEYQYESTPLMVHGVVYCTGGSRRDRSARHRLAPGAQCARRAGFQGAGGRRTRLVHRQQAAYIADLPARASSQDGG